jgi:hypothetical protein
MAYSSPTADFVTSTLSGALAAGATTATIGSGLDIPATNGVLHLDYTDALGAGVGADNGPETISYATYTTGTGALAGITRGVAGTTDVAHANGALVSCGISAANISGITIANANLSTTAGEPGGAWQAWTPTVGASGSMSIGSTTVVARYLQVGKTVSFYLYIAGTIGGSVSTTITATLPVTAKEAYNTFGGAQLQSGGSTGGAAIFCDNSTTVLNIRKYDAGNFSTGAGCVLRVTGTYEAA